MSSSAMLLRAVHLWGTYHLMKYMIRIQPLLFQTSDFSDLLACSEAVTVQKCEFQSQPADPRYEDRFTHQ